VDIKVFDYSLTVKSDKNYDLKTEDKKLRVNLSKFDLKVLNLDYDRWEKDYFKIEEECESGFYRWLEFYALDAFNKDFPYHIHVFLDFVYRYGHDEEASLKNISCELVEEFFADFLLRKVMVEPDEYPEWFPAVKLFYEYLRDIGYIDDISKITDILNEQEPEFIELLKNKY
jgi:hypothetical protein